MPCISDLVNVYMPILFGSQTKLLKRSCGILFEKSLAGTIFMYSVSVPFFDAGKQRSKFLACSCFVNSPTISQLRANAIRKDPSASSPTMPLVNSSRSSTMASLSILLCSACGKMTTPDNACWLNPTTSNLVTGLCDCVFHQSCANIFFQSNTYHCKKCNVAAISCKSVTNRTCLLCPAYSFKTMCAKCHHNFVHALQKKQTNVGEICVTDEIRSFLNEHNVQARHLALFSAWLVQELTLLKLPLFLRADKLFLLSAKTLLSNVLLRTVTLHSSVCVKEWYKSVYTWLEPIMHFTMSDVDEALHNIKINHSRIIVSKDGVMVLTEQKEYETKVLLPALGSVFCLLDYHNQNDRNSQQVQKIFLSEKNDYMYYLTLSDPVPYIPEFAQVWKKCQTNLS